MCNLFWVSTHKNFKRRNDLWWWYQEEMFRRSTAEKYGTYCRIGMKGEGTGKRRTPGRKFSQREDAEFLRARRAWACRRRVWREQRRKGKVRRGVRVNRKAGVIRCVGMNRKQVGDPMQMSETKAEKRRSKPGTANGWLRRGHGNGSRQMPCARDGAGKRDMRRVPTKRNEVRIFAEGGALESS